jgi:hypothetical protein
LTTEEVSRPNIYFLNTTNCKRLQARPCICNRRYFADWSCEGQGTVEGSCESGYEPSGSINPWKVLE